MLAIIAIVISLATCVLAGVFHVSTVKRRRKERLRFRRAIIASRHRTKRILTEALERHAKKIEGAIAGVAQKAAESCMPGVLKKLQTEQRQVNIKLARWLRREQRKLEGAVDMRFKPVESAMKDTTTITSKMLNWLKSHNPLGRKPAVDGKKSPSADGTAST